MKATILHKDDAASTHVIVLDKGDEVIATLTDYCNANNVRAGSITALGAFSTSRVAFFNRKTRNYDPIPADFQVEVLNLTGNVSEYEGEAKLHLHATLGKPDGTMIGGHLLEGIVWPTLEVMLTAFDRRLSRTVDDESGLPLLDLD